MIVVENLHKHFGGVHAVDGAWNWDGKARTNSELMEIVSKG